MESVGFIGLGEMGTAMAANIHRAGFPLVVFNRTAERANPFRAQGIRVCATPRKLAESSQVILIMVTDSQALDGVLDGPEGVLGALGPGKVVVNMSTVSVEATISADMRVRAKGAAFVDAPVSGSVKPAQDATLVILASGDDATLDRTETVLRSLGKTILRCGPAGRGTQLKLILNLMLGNMMQALAEGMILGQNFGVDPAMVLRALAEGPMAAPLFQLKGKAIADRNFTSQFPVRLMFKDLNLVLAEAEKAGMLLPQTAATRECFGAAVDEGLGNEDMAAVMRVLEHLAGKTG